MQEAGIAIDDALIGRVEFEAESAEAAVDALVAAQGPVRWNRGGQRSHRARRDPRAAPLANLTCRSDVSVVGYDNNLLEPTEHARR